jgi:hypothetical protein
MVYMVTVLLEFSRRFQWVVQCIENSSVGGSVDQVESLVKEYVQCCPDSQFLFSVFERLSQTVSTSTEIDNLIRTRLNHLLTIYGIFVELPKLKLAVILETARKCPVPKAVADSYLSLIPVVVTEDLPEKMSSDTSIVGGLEQCNLEPLFAMLLCRFHPHLQYSDDECKGVAMWADQNRARFFECASTGDWAGIGMKRPAVIHDTTAADSVPLKESKKRKTVHATVLEEYTPRAVFTAFGREHILRLLKTVDITTGTGSSDQAHPATLQDFFDCNSMAPWLRLVAKSVIDNCIVDGAFCTLQLPLAILSTSSPDDRLRTAAYSILHHVHTVLLSDQCRQFRERVQVHLLLSTLLSSTPQPLTVQPLARALFCAHLLHVLCQPCHPLYTLANSMLLRRAVFPPDGTGIPYFDMFLEGESGEVAVLALRFVQRIREAVVERGSGHLPEWQLARLQLLDLLQL